MVNFFDFIFRFYLVWFVLAIFDLLNDVEAMRGLCYLLAVSVNLF